LSAKNENICPFCLNKINPGAQKCHHCKEWLTKIVSKDDILLNKTSTDLKENKKENKFFSFQGRIAQKFPSIGYWYLYLFLSIFLFALISIYWTYSNERRIYLVSFFLYAVQMFCSSAGIVWFEKKLNNFSSEIPLITNWSADKSYQYFDKAKRYIFADRHSFITALIVCSAATLGDRFVVGSPFVSDTSFAFFLVYEAMYLFWTACLVAVFFKFALFVRSLGDEELHILLIQEENSGIRLLGKLVLQSALFVIIPYSLGIFARQIGEWNFGFSLIAWFGCFGIGFLFYLFYPIYNIHRAMRREKEKKLSLVSVELNNLLSGGYISHEHIHKVKDLIEIRSHLQSVNTWPFDMNKVAGLLSALVIPMASILIDLYLKS
jgi:hypothetical protein